MNLKIIKKYCNKLLIVAITIITSGLAQTSESLNIVLEINPSVKAAELAYRSALEKVKVAGGLPDPMIEGSISIEPIQTRNGPIDNQIMLSQKFPLWGKLRKEKNIEKVKAEMSRLNYENTKVNTVFQLRKLLADHAKYAATLGILNNYQSELNTFINIARTQYANGTGQTQHPIIKLQVEESLIRSQINTIESSLTETINNLQVLFDGQFPIENMVNEEIFDIGSFSEETWLILAKIHNPDFNMAQAQIAIATDQWKLSRLQNYPGLVAGLTYSFVGPTELGGAVSSGQDAFGVKFGFSLPVWFNKNRAKVKSTAYTLEHKEELLSDTWNRIESDILTNIKKIDETEQTFKLYDESVINDSEQMLSSAYNSYENGKLSFLDLLDSERLSSKVRLEFENIKARQTILRAELLHSVGLVYPN